MRQRLELLSGSYLVGAKLTGAVPARIRYRAAAIGGLAWYLASRGQARNALRNYGAVLGRPAADPEVARTARRAFQNYGRMLADFLLLGNLRPEQVRERAEVQGLDHLERALAAGGGCILALPHLGAWDVGAALGGVLGYRVLAATERFPGSLNQAVTSTRERFGVRVVHSGRSAVGLILEALAANWVVCLVCDLPSGPGIEVEFFGHRAVVPGGPAAFALKTGAPILPTAVPRTGPGTYRVELKPPLEVGGVSSGRAGTAQLTQTLVRELEEPIRRHPDQWYAFKPMFTPLGRRDAVAR